MADMDDPGSPEAVEAGCTCAVLDNHHGKGFTLQGTTVWWISSDCPIHGWPLEFGSEE